VAREATGQFKRYERKDGVVGFAVRFRYRGRRYFVKLTTTADHPSEKAAEKAARKLMDDVMSDVRREKWPAGAQDGFAGWTPPEERAPEPKPVPTFHEFASEWYARVEAEGGRDGDGLRERSVRDLRDWRLRRHVLPFWATYPIDAVDVEAVDRFKAFLRREDRLSETGEPLRLSPRSQNKMLTTLAAICEDAVDYGHLPRNPVKGRRIKKTGKPDWTYLETAAQVEALLAAADALDGRGKSRAGRYRRPLLAALVFGGFRIAELLDLRWSDVRIGDEPSGNVVPLPGVERGAVYVRGTKTKAAVREVKLRPALRAALKARGRGEPDARVFATGPGGRFSESNVRNRIIAPAVERANEALAQAGRKPIMDGITPHSLRRTFTSVRIKLGDDLVSLREELGHEDLNVLNGYARLIRDEEVEPFRRLFEGEPADVPAVVEAEEAS
jgi:integrase